MSCSKITFASRAEAKAFARKAPNVHSKRAYRCPYCGGWHLTSMTKVQRRSLERRRTNEQEGAA